MREFGTKRVVGRRRNLRIPLNASIGKREDTDKRNTFRQRREKECPVEMGDGEEETSKQLMGTIGEVFKYLNVSTSANDPKLLQEKTKNKDTKVTKGKN